MNISDLQSKSVVDITTGKNLGKIIDLVLDDSGNTIELIVEKKRFLNFFTTDSTIIKWSNINRIGEDVILISIDSSK